MGRHRAARRAARPDALQQLATPEETFVDSDLAREARQLWFGESGPLCAALAELVGRWRTGSYHEDAVAACADELEQVLLRYHRTAGYPAVPDYPPSPALAEWIRRHRHAPTAQGGAG